MAHPNAKPREEIEERREKIRVLLAKGYTKPGRLMAIQAVKDMYSTYKNPYARIIDDIRKIREENAKMVKLGFADEALGDLYASLTEQLIQCTKDYGKLEGVAKVRMARHILELIRAIAKARGIDPDKIDPMPFLLQVQTKIENAGEVNVPLPDEIIKSFGDYLATQGTNGVFEESETEGNSPE